MSENKRAVRSWSQLDAYEQCPEAYRLKKIEKVAERPAAWLPMGIAVHKAAEEYEKLGRNMTREEAKEIARDSYVKHTNRMLDEEPNTNEWFNSGRWGGKDDIERRFNLVFDHVDNYINYYEAHPEERIWHTPTTWDDPPGSGKPGIELYFKTELEGVPIRGYIDQVITSPTVTHEPRDVKSGAQPGTVGQLTLYTIAVDELADDGVTTDKADYLMTKETDPSKMVKAKKVTEADKKELGLRFLRMDEAVNAGNFPPNPSPENCRRCPVARHCVYKELS